MEKYIVVAHVGPHHKRFIERSRDEPFFVHLFYRAGLESLPRTIWFCETKCSSSEATLLLVGPHLNGISEYPGFLFLFLTAVKLWARTSLPPFCLTDPKKFPSSLTIRNFIYEIRFIVLIEIFDLNCR